MAKTSLGLNNFTLSICGKPNGIEPCLLLNVNKKSWAIYHLLDRRYRLIIVKDRNGIPNSQSIRFRLHPYETSSLSLLLLLLRSPRLAESVMQRSVYLSRRCIYSAWLTRGQHATRPAYLAVPSVYYEYGHTCFMSFNRDFARNITPVGNLITKAVLLKIGWMIVLCVCACVCCLCHVNLSSFLHL